MTNELVLTRDKPICDFCSSVEVVTDYDCQDYGIPVKGAEGQVLELSSIGKWAACRECAQLVDSGDHQGLENRAFRTFMERNAWADSPATTSGIRDFLHKLHRKFWEGRK